jgi:hypothetical protein
LPQILQETKLQNFCEFAEEASAAETEAVSAKEIAPDLLGEDVAKVAQLYEFAEEAEPEAVSAEEIAPDPLAKEVCEIVDEADQASATETEVV